MPTITDQYALEIVRYMKNHNIAIEHVTEDDVRYMIQRLFRFLYPSRMEMVDDEMLFAYLDKEFEDRVVLAVYQHHDPVYTLSKYMTAMKT